MNRQGNREALLPSDIIFARHGQYPSNLALIATGEAALQMSKLPDEEDALMGLNETGEVQAHYLRRHLLRLFPDDFEAYMSSDFARVIETANIAAPYAQRVVVEPTLRERDRGDIARLPKVRFEAQYPEELAKKLRSPLDWLPPNGETLRSKATALKNLLPLMGILAPNQPLPVFTSGEVMIAARSLPELGNLDDDGLKRGLRDGWPALTVDNAQFDHYTRRNPETGKLSDTFNYMMSVRAHSEAVIDSGWIRVAR